MSHSHLMQINRWKNLNQDQNLKKCIYMEGNGYGYTFLIIKSRQSISGLESA